MGYIKESISKLSNIEFWAIVCQEAMRRKLSMACGIKDSTVKPKYAEAYASDCEHCKFENLYFENSEI